MILRSHQILGTLQVDAKWLVLGFYLVTTIPRSLKPIPEILGRDWDPPQKVMGNKFYFCVINGLAGFSNGINRLINGTTRLINGLARLINGWKARPGLGEGVAGVAAPGQAPQPLISRVRPLINRLMLLLNRLMPLITREMPSINRVMPLMFFKDIDSIFNVF